MDEEPRDEPDYEYWWMPWHWTRGQWVTVVYLAVVVQMIIAFLMFLLLAG